MHRFLIMSAICLMLAGVTDAADTPKTLHPELALQIGHTGEVERVALSPDGAMAASAELSAGTIKIWDVRNGEVLHTIREPGHSLTWGLKFSPNGLLLAVAVSEGIKLWNTRTGALERFLPGSHGFGLFLSNDAAFAFSPDGHHLLQIADIDNKGYVLQLWNLRSSEVAWHLPLAQGNDYSVTFAPDGKTVMSLQLEDNVMRTWDTATGAPLATLPMDAKIAGPPVFSADGSLVAFLKARNEMFEIAVCDLHTGKMLRTLKENWDGFSCFAVSPNGNLLVVATADRTLNLWNPRRGELLQKLSLPDPYKLISAAISADGKTLVAGASNGSVLLYDLRTPTLPRLTRTLRGRTDSVSGVAYSADGSQIFSEVVPQGESLPQLHAWDVRAGILSRTQKESTFTLGDRVALSPDGAIRASAIRASAIPNPPGGTVQIVNTRTGGVLRALDDSQYVNSVVFINGGKTIAGGTTDKGLCLWDVATGILKQSIRPQPPEPENGKVVTSSPNGQLLASVEMMGNIQLWDAQQEPLKEPLRTIELNEVSSLLTTMAFSPDSSTLALARLSDILLIDVKTGQKVRSMAEHGGYVSGMAFSADGQRLVTGGDGTVKIWNAQTSRLLSTLYHFPTDDKTGTADYLVLTPEGYYSGSAASDRYVRFRMGDTLYPAESFQARYYRPDLVNQALNGEVLPPVGGFKGPFPPVAKLSADATDKIIGDSLTVTLAVTDDSAVRNAAFFVNGARVDAKPITADSRPLTADSRALTADAKALTADAPPLTADIRLIPEAHKVLSHYTALLPLPPGASHIKVQAIAFDDDGLQSPREELVFSRETTAAPQGKLLGLCVGVKTWRRQHPKSVDNQIGPFPNQAALDHAVLQTLDAQITRFPSAQSYHIYLRSRQYPVPFPLLIMYSRRSLPAFQEPCGVLAVSSILHKMTPQDCRWIFTATDQDIHTLAQQNASIEKLLNLHSQPWPGVPKRATIAIGQPSKQQPAKQALHPTPTRS